MVKYVRYLYIAIQLNETSFEDIMREYKKLFGELLYYKSSLKFFKIGKLDIGIIRINKNYVDKLVYTIKTMEHKTNSKIGPIYIGNTLKSVKSKLNEIYFI
ncbi:MAG TPA: hypothetical protein EYH44_02285 [Thermoprotei archaeon]|nr:hypothetical protein [Thermoprotei archaeon]